MTIRAICVDDEPLARQGLSLALKAHSDFQLVADFGSVEEALESQLKNIDVMFLDIEMPRQTGFDLLRQWPGDLPLVVFVTAYNQYALKAFEEQALDYVLKPIDEERFAAVTDRIREQMARERKAIDTEELVNTVDALKRKLARREAAISVKTDEGYFRLELHDLIYIEAAGDHTFLYLQDKHLITRQTLKHYREELADHDFHQVHKSVLVNKKHVVKASPLGFGDHEVTLSNGATVRLSRRYKPALQKMLAD